MPSVSHQQLLRCTVRFPIRPDSGTIDDALYRPIIINQSLNSFEINSSYLHCLCSMETSGFSLETRDDDAGCYSLLGIRISKNVFNTAHLVDCYNRDIFI